MTDLQEQCSLLDEQNQRLRQQHAELLEPGGEPSADVLRQLEAARRTAAEAQSQLEEAQQKCADSERRQQELWQQRADALSEASDTRRQLQ